YTISGAPANSPLSWQLYVTPPGGAESLYQAVVWGQTDAQGNATLVSGTYTNALLGKVRAVITIGGITRTVSFDCVPGFYLSVALNPIRVGQQQTYTISGAPANSPLSWQ